MKGCTVNFQDELESLIRSHYPVLTIISDKETRSWDMALRITNKRRKKSSNRR
jgi:hypothetical protein